MSKWALVIGSQTGGLEGVDHDATRMAAALGSRGFSVELLTGAKATRAGILGGYRTLIDHARDTGATTTAVVYYAGHGSYVEDPTPGHAGHGSMQVILPFDADAWTDDDFRGVSAWELSLLQAELTAITRNVTVILDCCHAAQMSRDFGPPTRVRAAKVSPRRLADHFVQLRAQGARFDTLHPAGNPHAVRLVAAGQHESARERPGASGQWSGALTDAFLTVLERIGDAEVSWATVGRAVRERVQAENPNQRPDVEGPVRRALFSLDEPPETRAVPVYQTNGTTRLRAGRIAGVVEGDVYGLAPALTLAYSDAVSLGTARVNSVTALEADVILEGRAAGAGPLAPDTLAFPHAVSLPRFPVALQVDGDLAAQLETAVVAAPRLRLATAGESPLVTIRREAGGLIVEDQIGPLSTPTGTLDREAIAGVVSLAGTVAAGRSVTTLAGTAAGLVDVEWGVVVHGKPAPRPPHDAELLTSEAIYVKITSCSPVPVYAHVFNVGLSGRVLLLSGHAPGGLRVAAGASTVLGNHAGVLSGLKLKWPPGVPTTSPRCDNLIVIITLTETDLRVLETDAATTRSAATRGASPLHRLLSQVHAGGTRCIEPMAADQESVQVIHRSFVLLPPGSTTVQS